MPVKRKPFTWKDPLDGKKHFLFVVPDFVNILENVIETEKQAESFFEEYEKLSPNAEINLGYFCNLIKDHDVREDAADLLMVDTHDGSGAMCQVFGPNDPPWGSSFGVLEIDGKVWTPNGIKELEVKEIVKARPKKATKAKKI